MSNLRALRRDINRMQYFMQLQDRNEQLYQYVLRKHLGELLPLIQHPLVGAYCLKYSLMFRSIPRGLFLTLEDRGHVRSVLRNWPERLVRCVSLTDGAAVGAAGDVGVQAIGSACARLALLTSAGGVRPSRCLPIVLDVGTDAKALLEDPIYVGSRHPRDRGQARRELVEELLQALTERCGTSLFLDLDGMEYEDAAALAVACRGSFPAYSDAAHGTPAAVLAGVLSALRATGGRLADQRFLLVGESPELVAIAELLEEAIVREGHSGSTVLEARDRVYLADRKGLVVRDRPDADNLEDAKYPYMRDCPVCPDLESAAQAAQPTVLIGLTTRGLPPFAFTRPVLETMANATARPIVLALSSRDVDGIRGFSEITAADAYAWTDGKALFADPWTNRPLELADGTTRHPRAVNTAHVFPGIARGIVVSRASALREDMLVEAARVVAASVSAEDLAKGALFPPVDDLCAVAERVAERVARVAYRAGVASQLPEPRDLARAVRETGYDPAYSKFG